MKGNLEVNHIHSFIHSFIYANVLVGFRYRQTDRQTDRQHMTSSTFLRILVTRPFLRNSFARFPGLTAILPIPIIPRNLVIKTYKPRLVLMEKDSSFFVSTAPEYNHQADAEIVAGLDVRRRIRCHAATIAFKSRYRYLLSCGSCYETRSSKNETHRLWTGRVNPLKTRRGYS